MELNDANLQTLTEFLRKTLDPDPAVRRPGKQVHWQSTHFKSDCEKCVSLTYICQVITQVLPLQPPFSYTFNLLAEKFLESVEGNQNYPLLLLTLLEKSQDNVIRVCAAVTFKNFIKRNWRIVSFTMKLVPMIFLPLEALETYSCTCSVKQWFTTLNLYLDCIIIYTLSSEGWRWAEQSVWVRPNSDQRKYCQFDAQQPRADPETGNTSPVVVTQSVCEALQKLFQPLCLCPFLPAEWRHQYHRKRRFSSEMAQPANWDGQPLPKWWFPHH